MNRILTSIMRKRNEGFTLIELLVVIAIIGILSSVVLASLNTARQRGQDAKLKSEMSGLRAAAELYYDGNSGSYLGMFTSNNTCASANASVGPYMTSIAASASAEACFSAAGAYVAAARLPSTDGGTASFWCVDHLGNSKARATTVTSASASGCDQ